MRHILEVDTTKSLMIDQICLRKACFPDRITWPLDKTIDSRKLKMSDAHGILAISIVSMKIRSNDQRKFDEHSRYYIVTKIGQMSVSSSELEYESPTLLKLKESWIEYPLDTYHGHSIQFEILKIVENSSKLYGKVDVDLTKHIQRSRNVKVGLESKITKKSGSLNVIIIWRPLISKKEKFSNILYPFQSHVLFSVFVYNVTIISLTNTSLPTRLWINLDYEAFLNDEKQDEQQLPNTNYLTFEHINGKWKSDVEHEHLFNIG